MDQGCRGPPWTGHGRGSIALPSSARGQLRHGLSSRGHGERAESLGVLTGGGLVRKRYILSPTVMNGGGGLVMLIDAVVELWRMMGGGGRS
jgi:hypothetical protein